MSPEKTLEDLIDDFEEAVRERWLCQHYDEAGYMRARDEARIALVAHIANLLAKATGEYTDAIRDAVDEANRWHERREVRD